MTNAMKQDTQFKVAKLNICPYYGNKVQIDCNGTMCNIQSTSATASRLGHVLHGAGRGVWQAEREGGGNAPSNSKTYIGWIPLFCILKEPCKVA